MSVDPQFFAGALIRWAHLLSAIIWVGFVYFMVLVQGPALRPLEPADRKRVLLTLMPPALWWLRWSAMATFFLGTVLFVWEYHRTADGFGNGAALKVDGKITDRALFIMWGITFALVLLFVVWFLIWPTWKKILAALSKGEAPRPALLSRTAMLGKFNACLSAAMLLFMMAPQNYLASCSTEVVIAMVASGTVVMAALIWVAGALRFGKA